ncbi:hypothetical protein IV102_20820 [bacterium]|nr:hypothetical protein [bacterium]
MKLSIRADLEIEHASHCYRLTSTGDELEFVIPSVAAAVALLGVEGADSWMRQAEEVLQSVKQQVAVTYRGVTLVTLGKGAWSAAAAAQALQWLQ